MVELSIIVPTYNERENLVELVRKIQGSLNINKISFELIIVDDNSPDGTGELAEQLSEKYDFIKVIHRSGRLGLASAVIDGFIFACSEILGVMDADFQHPPEIIPKLFEEIKRGADIVIASRYAKEGKIENWSFKRRLISIGATFLANLLLPVKVKDPLSGFFVLRKRVIQGVNLNPLGYKILLEILVKGKYAKVVEIPYTFRNRVKGSTKLSYLEQIIYLKHLYLLARFRGEIKRFIRFCLVGSSGIFVNIGLLWFITEFIGLFYLISAIFSIEIAIVSNFILNEYWTFKDRRNLSSSKLARALKFNLVSIVGLGINIIILWSLTEIIGMYYLISNLFGIFGAALWNYGINVSYTWR
jgi:dolichol-phosphate mannosyltransferase